MVAETRGLRGLWRCDTAGRIVKPKIACSGLGSGMIHVSSPTLGTVTPPKWLLISTMVVWFQYKLFNSPHYFICWAANRGRAQLVSHQKLIYLTIYGLTKPKKKTFASGFSFNLVCVYLGTNLCLAAPTPLITPDTQTSLLVFSLCACLVVSHNKHFLHFTSQPAPAAIQTYH